MKDLLKNPDLLEERAAAIRAHLAGKPVEMLFSEDGESEVWELIQPQWAENKRYRVAPDYIHPLIMGIAGFRPLKADEEWQAKTWMRSYLPDGYRPILMGERTQEGDEARRMDGAWIPLSKDGLHMCGSPHIVHVRTKRHLPTPEPQEVDWSCSTDVPFGCRIRGGETDVGSFYTVACVVADGISICIRDSISFWRWKDFCRAHQYTIDGVNWKPCKKRP